MVGKTQKEDLSESIEPLLRSEGRIRTIVTEVHGGRTPSVPAETLSERLSVDSGQPPQIIKEPIEAIDTASRAASEEGCIVYVTGSVYLVGKAIEEMVSRAGGDLLQQLQAHPPRALEI